MSRPPAEPITSLENPQVRLARSLLAAGGRRRHQAFLVEGVRLVEAAAAMARPQLVLHTPAFGRADARERGLLRRLQAGGAPIRPVGERVLAHVTDTVTPQGIVAVMPLPSAEAPREATPAGAALALILDAVADPGNAGTLLRSALGAGVSQVIATRGAVDLYSPKVVRAGAGAHFQVPLAIDQPWDTILRWLPPSCQVLVADAASSTPHWDVDWARPSAIVVGSEAHGVSPEAQALATAAIAIPARNVESLNVAVAGSVILFEALRQRHTATHVLPATASATATDH